LAAAITWLTDDEAIVAADFANLKRPRFERFDSGAFKSGDESPHSSPAFRSVAEIEQNLWRSSFV
jgi:hypothetical protein